MPIVKPRAFRRARRDQRAVDGDRLARAAARRPARAVALRALPARRLVEAAGEHDSRPCRSGSAHSRASPCPRRPRHWSTGSSSMKRDGSALCHVPCVAAVLREGDLGALARPRQPDMGQPPLLFEPRAAGIVEAALMREQPFVPAGQEHGVEFEPLGRMQRHQADALGAFFGLRIHHQRHMLEETGERVELLHEADQLFQVLELRLRLRRALGLPHAGIAGLIEDQLGELGMRAWSRSASASGRRRR